MIIDYLKITFGIIIAVLVQYFFIDKVDFGPFIKPFPYLLSILFLNFERNKFAQLGFAFFAGFLMYLLHLSYGIHTASCVAMLFFKIKAEENVLNTESIILQGSHQLTAAFKGFRFYFFYFTVLIGIHHLVFFTLDFYKWSQFFSIIFAAAISTLATFLFIHLIRTYIIKR